MLFLCLLFFFLKSAYYSGLVYPLKDVTFILKDNLFVHGCIVALVYRKWKYNPLVLSFAFEKKVSKRENTVSAAEEGWTSTMYYVYIIRYKKPSEIRSTREVSLLFQKLC